MLDRSSVDYSPENMRRSLNEANHILNSAKSIDLSGPARVDISPLEQIGQGLAELVAESRCGGILLSEVSSDTIRRASRIHSISTVKAEVSLWSTDIFHNDVAETCRELRIVVLTHSLLGRGMLVGNFKTPKDVANSGFHSMIPRFQDINFKQNLRIVDEIAKIARRKSYTSTQLSLLWLRY